MHRTNSLLLLLILATPAWSQGGMAGVVAGQPVTVDSLFRGPQAPRTLVAAHRANSGAWLPRYAGQLVNQKHGKRRRAENSVAAIAAAIDAGAHVIEVDVRCTRDDQLVLMHDDTIDRTTRGKGKVEDLTLAELRAIPLVPSGTIPTLAEAIQAARDRAVLDLDLKTDRVDLVVAVIQAEHAHQSAILFKRDADVLRRARQLDPRVQVMPRSRSAADVIALLNEFHPPAIHLNGPEDLTPAVRQAAADAGARLWINALGPKDLIALRRFYRRLAEDGAGVIQTDRPTCVAKAIRSLP